MWNWPPYQFYAMWQYAKENPSQALTVFNSAKSKLSAARPSYCSPACPGMWPQAVNGLIAGYKGYVELAKLAGQPSSVYGPYETTLNSLLTERKNNFQISPVQTLGTTGTNNAANYYATLKHAWNFMYLTPALADYLNVNAKTKVQDAVNTYTAEIPLWFEALNREVQGEGAATPYQQTHSLFQAKALILKESYNELAKRLDAPMMLGDLYYLDNLISTIQVSCTGTNCPTSPPVTTGPSPTTPPIGKPGDANGDDKVDGLDYVAWLNHYNQSATGAVNGDFNNSGKVDGLDYVIWLNNYNKTVTTGSAAGDFDKNGKVDGIDYVKWLIQYIFMNQISPTPTITPSPSISLQQTACENQGYIWKIFSNGCVDSCDLAANPQLNCTQVLTPGCDCGADSCWNGTSCQNNP